MLVKNNNNIAKFCTEKYKNKSKVIKINKLKNTKVISVI